MASGNDLPLFELVFNPFSSVISKKLTLNQREFFLRHVAQTSTEPMLGVDLNIVRASGCTLTDVNGKSYFDLISGISVSSIGHCHPAVIKAIRDQSEKY